MATTANSAKNVIIFVADGLRNGSVNATDTPTLYSIRQQGVSFTNSNSLFPTFTTPNASAIATGHLLGDTGDFSNTIYTGFPTPNAAGSVTPFIENNAVLGDIDEKFPGLNGFLDEESLLAYARAQGFATAAVGKLGPVAIQDVTQANRSNSTTIPTPTTVIIDDRTGATANSGTGSPTGVPIPTAIQQRMTNAGLPLVTPGRGANGSAGNSTTAGTTVANTTQQQFFADVTTKAILPQFQADGKQFALVYWSRDPDGSQHNQGDSLNTLTPGINGPTSKAGVKDADTNLKQLLDYLKATDDPNSPGKKLIDTTDVFITADHGFSTISKQAIDSKGTPTTSYAAQQTYSDVNKGFLPVGFVAIDLAHDLGLTLYDPDKAAVPYSNGNVTYTVVDATKGQRPVNGNGVIGGAGTVVSGKLDSGTKLVVAANGGSDLIYLPSGDTTLITQVVNLLSQKDYVSGIFVDDRTYGSIAGALPMSSIGLIGSAQTPVPAIVVNFKTFSTNPNNPNDPQSQVEIADTGLQQGQGMHGSFGRGDTFNNMEAIGPDFKVGYVDNAPVSNADVTPTLASILGFNIPSTGTLKGRAITEALVGGADVSYTQGQLTSAPSASGQSTILNYQTVGSTQYFTTAGFSGRTVGLPVLSLLSLGGTTQTFLQSSVNSTTGKVDLIFNLTQTKHQNLNEIGVFEVDDDKGTINGIAAGNTQAYIQAALRRSQIIFAALPTDDVLQVTKQSSTRQLSFSQSARLAFYLVSNDTSNKVLSDLSSGKAPSSTAPVFFNFASANSDKVEHVKVNNSTSTSGLTLNWNDQVGGGSTFTGAVVAVQAQNTANTPSVDAGSLNLLLDLTKVTSAISTTCTVNSEAAYSDFVGYYKIADASGTITLSNGTSLKPGDAGYAQAAIQQAVQNLGLSNGGLSGTGTVRNANTATQNLLAGSLLAPFLITNGDIQSFLAKNGSNATTDAASGKTPLAYFAYANANPDQQDHIRGIGGNRFGCEDLYGKGDSDFNDVVFQLNPSQTLTTAAVTI